MVCENVGTLSVKLRRKGALDNLAFVRVSIKEMSATEGVDFVPSTAEQVQFNPGKFINYIVELLYDNII